jgi:hypothetical protein
MGSSYGSDYAEISHLLLSAINRLTYLLTCAIDIACKRLMLAPYHHQRKNIFAN